MSVLNEAREKNGFKNVWTYVGRILYKDNSDGQKMVTIKMGKKLGCIFFAV